MSHTPGPWVVALSDSSGDLFVREATPYVLGRRLAVARVTSVSRADTEINANARLIAAAPDLLAALEEILGLTPEDAILDEDIVRAREAVKKARGK